MLPSAIGAVVYMCHWGRVQAATEAKCYTEVWGLRLTPLGSG